MPRGPFDLLTPRDRAGRCCCRRRRHVPAECPDLPPRCPGVLSEFSLGVRCWHLEERGRGNVGFLSSKLSVLPHCLLLLQDRVASRSKEWVCFPGDFQNKIIFGNYSQSAPLKSQANENCFYKKWKSKLFINFKDEQKNNYHSTYLCNSSNSYHRASAPSASIVVSLGKKLPSPLLLVVARGPSAARAWHWSIRPLQGNCASLSSSSPVACH